jgi:hypothetical protein
VLATGPERRRADICAGVLPLIPVALWFHLHIAGGPLVESLRELSYQSQAMVLYDVPQVSQVSGRGVEGYTTLTGALCTLLRGSGMTFTISPEGIVTVGTEPPDPRRALSRVCAGIGEPYIEPPNARWQ